MVSPITMMTPDTGIEYTTTVVIAGIVTVLGVLILLILVFFAFGNIVSKAEKKAKTKSNKKKENVMLGDVMVTPAAKPAPMPVPAPVPAPVVEEGISGEVVAAIAAAVAMSEGSAAVVRSIKKVNVSVRNPWAAAAIADNTRPF